MSVADPFIVDMAQAVSEMLQGVGMVVVATVATVVIARMGINKLFS